MVFEHWAGFFISKVSIFEKEGINATEPIDFITEKESTQAQTLIPIHLTNDYLLLKF